MRDTIGSRRAGEAGVDSAAERSGAQASAPRKVPGQATSATMNRVRAVLAGSSPHSLLEASRRSAATQWSAWHASRAVK